MLWLSRPPILRWCAALCLVVAAAWSEFSPPATVEVPFLTVDLPAGSPITADALTLRPMPAPGLPPPPSGGVAAIDLRAGDPLVASMVATVAIPSGWFVIPAEVPPDAPPGATAIGVVLPDLPGLAPVSLEAIVVTGAPDDPFGPGSGSVAVPPASVALAAAASSSGRLVIGFQAP